MLGFDGASSDRYYEYDYTREEWGIVIQYFNSYRLGRRHGFKKRTYEAYKNLAKKLCIYLISAIVAIAFGVAITFP